MAVPKRAAEDTVFTATRADPNDPTTAQVHVPKGTIMGIDIPAVHYNRVFPSSHLVYTSLSLGLPYTARHWPNPQEFNPDRFLGEWNRDALIAFSGGLRYVLLSSVSF